MRNVTFYTLVTIICTLLLTACNGFFEKDNLPPPAPLPTLTPDEMHPHLIWSTRTGLGVGDEYLRLTPAISETTLYTTSSRGIVTAVNRADGRRIWETDTRLPLSAGPGIGLGTVVVGSRYGEVLALHDATGKIRWRSLVSGEILAKPAISQNKVIIKTTDGFVRALALSDGRKLWAFQQTEPNLILHGASTPLITDGKIIVGFANGNLAKLNLSDGQLLWLQTVSISEGAFAIERMIDIDANPLLFQHHIYAATYQGEVASLNWASGKIRWSHSISSYTGMTAEQNTLYITDANSFVWAFNAQTGTTKWKQTQLRRRDITAPAIIGNYLVVGDAYGYLHWLDKRDGHFVARDRIRPSLHAAPLVKDNTVYVFADNGVLRAYRLGQ